MAKQTCPNGHIYDPNIYGNQCPMCPKSVSSPAAGITPPTQIGGAHGMPPMPGGGGMHTQVGGPAPGVPFGIPTPSPAPAPAPAADAAGATAVRPQNAAPAPAAGGHTVIRRPGQGAKGATGPSRKLVGFLVTYNREPNGKAYSIYEGRNYIGRDANNDVSVPDDDQMSGKHFSILYRNVDDKFKFRDEQSSNGTFINKELVDDGELQNYDIIRAGGTIFVFVAIPKIS